jgi:hypothetical protein
MIRPRFGHFGQVLQRARAAAPAGRLLPPALADGCYGTRFWEYVARGLPGRTAADCIDAYAASPLAPAARSPMACAPQIFST